MRADQTPVIYPVFDVTWWDKYPATHIVLTNGGKGIGRQITGRITYDAGIPWEEEPVWPQVEIVPTILSAGETQSVRLANKVNDWRQAYGFIDYRDMEGVLYRCDWQFNAIGEKPYFEVLAIDERAKMGDPPERR